MGQQPVSDSQPDWSGGLNSVSAPEFLRPDQARQMQNISLTAFGAASKRLGTMYVSTLGFAIVPRRALYWPNQSTLIWGGGGGSAASIYATGTSIPATATALTAHTTAQSYPQDFCVFSDGTNETMYVLSADQIQYPLITVTSLQKTAGASSLGAALASIPSPISGMTVYNSRLWGWAAGLNNNLYYSNLSTAIGSIGGDSLGVGASGGGQIVVTTFGFAPIVACLAVGASLLIFHNRGISRLTGFGQSDITVLPQSLSADVGLWSRTAIDEYNGTAYFVSARGLYRANEGAVAPVGTPEKPDPLVPILSTLALTNQGVWVRYNRSTNEVWISLGTKGVYIYNVMLDAWYGPYLTGNLSTGIFENIQCMAEVVDTNGFPHLWLGGVGQGNLFFVQTDTANAATPCVDGGLSSGPGGASYPVILQAHRMYGQQVFGQPSPKGYSKSWRWANILATLTAAAAAPVCVQSSMLGTPATTTFSGLVSVPQVYYNSGGEFGPYVDVTITETGSQNSQYDSVYVEGFLLGQR